MPAKAKQVRVVRIDTYLAVHNVVYVDRKPRQRWKAAQFYRADHSLEKVKAWVRAQPHLILQEDHLKDIPPAPVAEDNTRFVWNIGAIAEIYPDMPEQTHDTVLWDRQERKPVITVHGVYGQAICLQTTAQGDAPFDQIEVWLNSANNKALASENIPPTRENFNARRKA